MKKRHIITLIASLFVITTMAKDIKTVVFTTQPQMHCENCENKIKGNLRFEKGVKKIETNIERQEVVITYDADKTTEEKLKAAFEKIGYDACNIESNSSKQQDDNDLTTTTEQ